jgi:O-antigen ligase
MDAPVAVAVAPQAIGAVAAAGAVVGAFVLPSPRARAAAVLVALALIPALLLADLWDSPQVSDFRESPARAAAAAAAALVLAAALAALFVRRPEAFPILAVAALPFRVPIEAGGETANLLVPLYVVVAGGGLAYAYGRLRLGMATIAPREREPGRVELALMLALGLYALQLAYSTDFSQGLENLVFFYLPFAILLKLLAAVEWSRELVLRCLGVAAALALVFVAVGFWEYATRRLLLNPKVIEANQFQAYFRVNSLFFDPNIYGRFLAIVMTALAGVLIWGRSRRDVLACAVVLTVLWAGLLLTFSQSSFGALLAGLAVLAALRWGPRLVAASMAAVAVLGAVLVVGFPGLLNLELESGRDIDAATSGRIDLMEGGASMFLDRPVWGYGPGAFTERFRAREDVGSERAIPASHTIPITVAAEQGVIGLAVYVLVMVTALGMLFGGLRALRERAPPDTLAVARGAIAAAFVALAVHTLFYAAFLEDPVTWTLLGAGLGLAASRPSSGASASSSSRPASASAPARTGSSIP